MLEAIRRDLARQVTSEGVLATCLPDVSIVHFTHPHELRGTWTRSLCLVAGGAKELLLERERFAYKPGQFVLASIDLPLVSRVTHATRAKPYLCLRIELDPAMIADVVAQLDERAARRSSVHRALFVGDASPNFLAAAARLANLLPSPDDARVLGPAAIREMIYWLLRGELAPHVMRFATPDTDANRILRAAQHIRDRLAHPLDVTSLCRTAGMSRSTFFAKFNQVTATSPIQYQKQLRLARGQQLLGYGEDVADAAHAVGYASASQFSREYSRMFGHAPRLDIAKPLGRRRAV
ncbi:MAG: AraC family transcriptional regulator [Kofleriaceae bacterium]